MWSVHLIVSVNEIDIQRKHELHKSHFVKSGDEWKASFFISKQNFLKWNQYKESMISHNIPQPKRGRDDWESSVFVSQPPFFAENWSLFECHTFELRPLYTN